MRYTLAVAASAILPGIAAAQPLQVTSQHITLNYPQSAEEVLQPAEFGTFSRQGEYVDTVLGGSAGGAGDVRISGTASAATSWDGTLLSWSSSTFIRCDILDPFELDEYGEVSQQGRTRIELRFEVSSPISVIATRSPSLSGQSSGPQAFCNFSLPSVRAVDDLGQIIPNSGFIIDSLSGQQHGLQPGSYVALLTTQSLFLSGSFGSPPIESDASTIDGAMLQVVPVPATLVCLLGFGTIASRRRR